MINLEIWLDWIQENSNYSYEDLEFTRICLEYFYVNCYRTYGNNITEYHWTIRNYERCRTYYRYRTLANGYGYNYDKDGSYTLIIDGFIDYDGEYTAYGNGSTSYNPTYTGRHK